MQNAYWIQICLIYYTYQWLKKIKIEKLLEAVHAVVEAVHAVAVRVHEVVEVA